MNRLTFTEILGGVPVVPVLIVESVAMAVPMARALVAGGLPLLEITLRTPVAFEAMRAIVDEVEGAIVGAGTVLTTSQFEETMAVGCKFAVSPGATERLLDAAADAPIPLLPGTANASDVMRLLDRGITSMKFFPAEQAGGVAYLKALSSPLADARFCPTGGIDAAKAPSYLALPNVMCVGGSWVAPAAALAAGDWAQVTALAKAAAALR